MSDDSAVRINRMADEIEVNMAEEKEYKMSYDKREKKKQVKGEALVETQRQRRVDKIVDDKLENADIFDNKEEGDASSSMSENDGDLEEERMITRLAKQLKNKR